MREKKLTKGNFVCLSELIEFDFLIVFFFRL